MNNKEKALQILNETDKLGILHKGSLGESVAISCIVKALNEKDAKFKEYLEKTRKKYTTGLSIALQKNATQEAVVNDKIQCLLNEIINELFKEN